MEEKIIEGNKIIAEFEGAVPNHFKSIDGQYWKWFDGDMIKRETREDKFKYHTSWDWLMPVVEKIGKEMDLTILGVLNHFNKTQPDFWCEGIESIWKAVVQQITWYNQNKQP